MVARQRNIGNACSLVAVAMQQTMQLEHIMGPDRHALT